MTEPDNFIQRWARLKRESDTAHEADLSGDSLPPESVESALDAAGEEPFDLTSLPSIEAITANTDIRGFLQSRVPAELTRAALRQAWASDPAIRDFIGIAENQWDFNDPNAIPGFGPLPATGNAPAFLTQASSRLENIPKALPEMPASVECARSSVVDPEHSAADQGTQLTPDESRSGDPGISRLSSEMSEAGTKTENACSVEECDASRSPRRHGSALPR
jgi:hypothetical protein